MTLMQPVSGTAGALSVTTSAQALTVQAGTWVRFEAEDTTLFVGPANAVTDANKLLRVPPGQYRDLFIEADWSQTVYYWGSVAGSASHRQVLPRSC